MLNEDCFENNNHSLYSIVNVPFWINSFCTATWNTDKGNFGQQELISKISRRQLPPLPYSLRGHCQCHHSAVNLHGDVQGEYYPSSPQAWRPTGDLSPSSLLSAKWLREFDAVDLNRVKFDKEEHIMHPHSARARRKWMPNRRKQQTTKALWPYHSVSWTGRQSLCERTYL